MYDATVIIHLPQSRERSHERASWHPRLLERGWYTACERLLRSYGYRGEWPSSPWGPHGRFARQIRTGDALVRELSNLESLVREPWEALGTPPD